MVTPPTIEVANIGMADTLILMVMALVVFGPRKLPQIGRQIGKLMYEFRKASNDFKFQMEEELRNSEEADRRKQEEERLRALAATPPQPAPTTETGIAPPAENANPSPYPDEADYPAVIMPAERAPAGETYPKIQPPSTGVQVPAAKPWSLEAELAKGVGAETGSEAGAGDREPALVSTNDQPTDAAEKTEQPEQAAHHG
jgi:sec-independent protein translocase protein TatB